MAVTANCKLKKVRIRSSSGLRKVFFNLVKYRINKTEAFAFLRATTDEKKPGFQTCTNIKRTKRTCLYNVFIKTTEIFGGSRFFFFYIFIMQFFFWIDTFS